jgi:hypothetical protein
MSNESEVRREPVDDNKSGTKVETTKSTTSLLRFDCTILDHFPHPY